MSKDDEISDDRAEQEALKAKSRLEKLGITIEWSQLRDAASNGQIDAFVKKLKDDKYKNSGVVRRFLRSLTKPPSSDGKHTRENGPKSEDPTDPGPKI